MLGHALYMRMIHGGKSKTDKIDAAKIAGLLRGGLFPQAYVYPKDLRETRDAGKVKGAGCTKIGNAHLRWAFGKAAFAMRPERVGREGARLLPVNYPVGVRNDECNT